MNLSVASSAGGTNFSHALPRESSKASLEKRAVRWPCASGTKVIASAMSFGARDKLWPSITKVIGSLTLGEAKYLIVRSTSFEVTRAWWTMIGSSIGEERNHCDWN
ncbi:hypothetical protein GALL_526470 [mine drainage metagenome]|uniref:Uncharacterized protein n=1 Tax=mine drainage metagenome TaxID=410659 RepID=A0A1J5PD87_9ZZZZ